MPKLLTAEEITRRFTVIAKCQADGLSQHDTACKVGISQPALCQFLKRYGAKRGETSKERMRRKKKTYCYNTVEPWQVADHRQFPDDIITEAVRLLQCTREHAAWVLSCPKDFVPQHRSRIGHRGGSAIG